MGLITSVVGKLQTHPVALSSKEVAYQRKVALEKWKQDNPDKIIVDGKIQQLPVWTSTSHYKKNYPYTKKSIKEIKKLYKDLIKINKRFSKLNINDQSLQDNLKVMKHAITLSNPEKVARFHITTYLSIRQLANDLRHVRNLGQYNEFINRQISVLEKSYVDSKNGFSAYLESEEKINHKIEKMNSDLNKQKADLNSGKNVGANDPQKAEKLAKIAKLQRELDELKGEISEDVEPVLSNNDKAGNI